MNLIVIYGPPAAGKLTVGKILAEKTGFKLFHNHLTVDVVTSIFAFDSGQLPKLLNKIRLDVLEEAAKANISGVILTLTYESGEAELDFCKKLVDMIHSYNGEVYFVKLNPSESTIRQRITEESRKIFNKPKDPKVIDNMFEKFDIFATIPNSDSLIINNDALSPVDTAQKIIDHYKLKKLTS